MKISRINHFLERFKKLAPPNLSIRRSISESIKKRIGFDIDITEVSFNQKTGVVYIEKEGHFKNKLFIKKDKIIKEANKKLGKDIIKDLR